MDFLFSLSLSPPALRALWRLRYLHDEEEDQDDEDADVRMEPHSRAAQAGRRGILGDFGPGEIIEKGVYTLPRHQLQHKRRSARRIFLFFSVFSDFKGRWRLTSPAMNCPNPGGKVKVAMISVTAPG